MCHYVEPSRFCQLYLSYCAQSIGPMWTLVFSLCTSPYFAETMVKINVHGTVCFTIESSSTVDKLSAVSWH